VSYLTVEVIFGEKRRGQNGQMTDLTREDSRILSKFTKAGSVNKYLLKKENLISCPIFKPCQKLDKAY
jgi:hypothetical protein